MKINIMFNAKSISIFFTAIMLFGFNQSLYSSIDQTSSERKLKENRGFINFIDIPATNFGDEKFNMFKDAYEKHFNADVAFLQSDYVRAYKKVYASQAEMVKLYKYILRRYYLEGAKNILDKIAPNIIRSKNPRARLYLTLGYRDRTVCWTHFIVGGATNPKLYSYKLFKYEEAIKMARRAKRYGFLAIFESQKPEVKFNIYKELLKAEREKKNKFFNRFLGKNENDYIVEIGKTHVEHLSELKKNKDSAVKHGVRETFGNRIQGRIDFMKEKRVARHLLNREFEMAEDIIRKYVEDFNYKIIVSTFSVLSSMKLKSRVKIDYEKFRIHHMDNYLKLKKDSTLRNIMSKVKVEDDIDESDNNSTRKNEKSTTIDKKTDKSDLTKDNKDNKDKIKK